MELTEENNKLTYVHTSYYEPVSVIANSHQIEKMLEYRFKIEKMLENIAKILKLCYSIY